MSRALLSPGELQSSASYCKVLHNLGQGPRIVLASLIADGPASTPHPGLLRQSEATSGLSLPIGGQECSPPCQKLRGHKDPEPGPGPASCLKLFGTKPDSDSKPGDEMLPISLNIVWPGSSQSSAFVSGPLISMFILRTYQPLSICNLSINTRYTEDDN